MSEHQVVNIKEDFIYHIGHFKNKLFISISVYKLYPGWLEAFSIIGTELICKLLCKLMVGLNVGQGNVLPGVIG